MRTRMMLVCAAVAVLLVQAAGADVLKLSNGGELKGTLEEIAFLSGGKQTKQARADILTLRISEVAKDSLTLNDGTTLEGELVSLKFKSVGGSLTFERKEVASVSFLADPLAEARKTFLTKKADLAPNDAKALLELAQWCSEKGLKAEAAQCAKECLAIDPNGENSDACHKLLGDVQYKDKWVTAAEAAKLRAAEGENKDPDKKEPDVPKDSKLTAEEISAIKESIAKNDELNKTYQAKAAEVKTQESAAVKDKHSRDWDSANTKITALIDTIRRKEKAREDLKKQYTTGTTTGTIYGGTVTGVYTKPNDGLEVDQENLAKAKVERARLGNTIRDEMGVVSRNDTKRKDRVSIAYNKNKRILLTGKNRTVEDMTAEFDAALK